jgi:hypothetical protein
MSKDPERCCVVKSDGTRCPNKPMYKIGRRGFCQEHRSHAIKQAKSSNRGIAYYAEGWGTYTRFLSGAR